MQYTLLVAQAKKYLQDTLIFLIYPCAYIYEMYLQFFPFSCLMVQRESKIDSIMYHCFFFFSIEMIISLRVLLFQTTVSLYSIVDIQNSSQCHRGANLNFLLAIIFYIFSHIHEKNADTLSMHISFLVLLFII